MVNAKSIKPILFFLFLFACSCSEKQELENDVRHRVYVSVEYPNAIETHIEFGDTIDGAWHYSWPSTIVVYGNQAFWNDAEIGNAHLWKQHYVAWAMQSDRTFKWKQNGTVGDSIVIK